MSHDDLRIIQSDDGLAAEVRPLIVQTREGVARTVHAGMTLLYWRIGKPIHSEVFGNERTGYDEEIIAKPSRNLS